MNSSCKRWREAGSDDRFLHLQGSGRIRYRLIGGEAGKPWLIFLHEGLGCIELWRDFPGMLCDRTGCPGLVYDRLGYGGSDPGAPGWDSFYLHRSARTELAELVATLLTGLPQILIGHSDGASISLIYGANHSALLLGMALEAAHVFVEPETIIGIQAAVRKFTARGFAGLARYHGDKAEGLFGRWAGVWLSQPFGAWNIESLLPGVGCPVLALQGEGDQYGTPRQLEAIAAGVSGPVERHLIANCGHTPHLEQQERVLELMAHFIKPLTQPQRANA